MSALLAIDAGGTATRAVVVDPSGRCLGYGQAGGGNPISSGLDSAAAALGDAARAALASAPMQPEEIGCAVVAMAGARTHLRADEVGHHGVGPCLAAAGLRVPFAVESDLLATFFAGTYALDGYAMVAGTGAAAVRVRAGRVEAVADGMGWLLGDAGSGFWIGREVARAVVAALDGRGPATQLTALLLDALGIVDGSEKGDEARPVSLRHLTDLLYEMRPVRLAQFAPLAFAAPSDETARRIVEMAAEALVGTLAAVTDPGIDGPLVLGGSVLLRQKVLTDAIEESLRVRGRPGPMHLVADGTVGAAVLALRHSGISVAADVFARVGESLARLR